MTKKLRKKIMFKRGEKFFFLMATSLEIISYGFDLYNQVSTIL